MRMRDTQALPVLMIACWLGLVGAIGSLAAQQPELNEGDNVHDYFARLLTAGTESRYDTVYYGWAGLETTYNSTNVSDRNIAAVVIAMYNRRDAAAIAGVLQGQAGSAYYVLDLDGDRVLDYTTPQLILPYWTLQGADIPRGDDRAFWVFLDEVYAMMQQGAVHPSEYIRASQAHPLLYQAAADQNMVNRDLFFAMFFYLAMANVRHTSTFDAMEFVRSQMFERYGELHPIVLQYQAEAAMTNNLWREASVSLQILLEASDPNSVLGRAYDIQYFTEDPDERQAKLAELVADHPDHRVVTLLVERLSP